MTCLFQIFHLICKFDRFVDLPLEFHVIEMSCCALILLLSMRSFVISFIVCLDYKCYL